VYSTLDDLKKAASERTLAQLSDDTAGAEIDEDVVAEATIASDEIIDAHLRGRYELPFPEDATPPILTRLSVSITLFHLYSRRPEGEVPKAVETRYRDAVRMLEAIRDGKITVGTGKDGEEHTPAAPEGDVYRTQKKKTDKVFSDIDN